MSHTVDGKRIKIVENDWQYAICHRASILKDKEKYLWGTHGKKEKPYAHSIEEYMLYRTLVLIDKSLKNEFAENYRPHELNSLYRLLERIQIFLH